MPLTERADSVEARFEFGPHGLRFTSTPVTLKVFRLNTSLLGRGGKGLTLLCRPEAGTAWSPIATQVSLQNRWLVSTLEHFSNYAIAY